jgi:hypothetical protein
MSEATLCLDEGFEETSFVDQGQGDLSDSFGDTARGSARTAKTDLLSLASDQTFNALAQNLDITAYPIHVLLPDDTENVLNIDKLYSDTSSQLPSFSEKSEKLEEPKTRNPRRLHPFDDGTGTNSYIHNDILGFENLMESLSKGTGSLQGNESKREVQSLSSNQ